MKGKLTTTQTLTARNVVTSGGSTPSGPVTWSQVRNKPFSIVDTTGGLTIYDNTLGLDTLDTIATIDYVDQQIDGVTTTLEDYALKSEIPDVSNFITADALTPYVQSSELASVATSGDYDDLLNKPTIPTVPTDVSAFNNDAGYITSESLTPYVQSSALTTVAYSGDYGDLINKPTIPAATSVTVTQTLSSGTEIGKIDVDGLTTTLYAPAGSSVTIDNKSIIKNQNDELQEAVPVYSAYETKTYNCFNNWGTPTFYNGEDTSDCGRYIYETTHADTSKQWKFIINYDYNNNTYQMEGHLVSNTVNTMWSSNVNVDLDTGSGHGGVGSIAVITEGSGSSQKWGARVKLNSPYITINFLAFPEVPYDDTYTSSANVTTEVVYKVPNKYLPIETNESAVNNLVPMLYTDSSSNIRAYKLGAGTSMSVGTINLADGTKGYQLNCTLTSSPVGGYFSTNQGSFGIGYRDVTIDSTHFKLQLTNWSNFYNSWGSGNYSLTFKYCYGNYGDQVYTIVGAVHTGATVNDTTLEGFESIVDTVSYDSSGNTLDIYFKENIRHNGAVNIYKFGGSSPVIQRVNSYWLPLDKSTILIDSNGNLKTVYPACPTTTDGTYTLQATVSSGVVTYSWI